LQEKVYEKRRSQKPAVAEPVEERKAQSVCEDPPSAAKQQDAPETLDMYMDASPLMPEAPAAETPKPLEEEDTTKTTTLIFRYTMDALIALVLLDGCRRWRGRADGQDAKVCDEAQQGSPQFHELMQAVSRGDEAEARELLGKSGSVAVEEDCWGCTALHAAAKGGMRGLTTELIDLGAKVDAADSWDDTALHMAARAGHAQVCELLITRGAKVDATNAQSWTPLVVAGNAERSDACQMLLGKGAGVGGLPEKELPPLLRQLRPTIGDEATPTTVAPEDEEDQCQWPTEQDWEEHMKESVGF